MAIFLWASVAESVFQSEGPLTASGWLNRCLAFACLAFALGWVIYYSRGSSLITRVLRVAVVAIVALTLAIEPAWVSVHKETLPGRVVLAVDVSSSMDATDPQRTPEEKSCLSNVLGGYALLDAVPRREVVRRLLGAEGLNLTQRLRDQHHVEIIVFHERIVDGSALAAPGGNDVFETDLRLPLDASLKKIDANEPLLGVVLFTDGQHVRGPSPSPLARELGSRGVPIYPVAIGAREPPRDLAMISLSVPAQAFQGAEIRVDSKVRVHDLPAQTIDLELWRTGPKPLLLDKKSVVHAGKNDVLSEYFDIKLEELGLQRLEVRASPRRAAPKELTTANNHLAAPVRVVDEKFRVLVTDGEARWEYHYLAAALARDPDVRLDRILFEPPSLGASSEADRIEQKLPASHWPKNKDGEDDPLWQYDVIVLGDVSPRHLPLEVQHRLDKFVAEREGTLVLCSGRRSMPLEFLTQNADQPLTRWLPVESLRAIHPKKGFSWHTTDFGKTLPFLDRGDSGVPLPPFYWGLVGKLRPGAAALADVSGEMPGTIFATQNVGLGKVLWLGVDGTWRWRFRTGDTVHHAFWGQLTRWAASERKRSDRPRVALVRGRKPFFTQGEAVEAIFQLGPAAPRLATPPHLKVVGEKGTAATIHLHEDAGRPGFFTGKAPPLPAGNYTLTADIPELDVKAIEGDRTFAIVPPERGELADLAVNWKLLQALAEQSGGQLLTADEASQLPDLLARRRIVRESRDVARPWRDPPWLWASLAVVLGLVSLEWILRKRAGHP